MAKKQKHKPSKVDARISDRTRYGVDLMSRKLGMSVSAYIGRAIEQSLVADGIDAREAGQMYSKLEKLWSPNAAERVLALCLHEPELATPEEQLTGILLNAVKGSSNVGEFLKSLEDKDYEHRVSSLESIGRDCTLAEAIIKTKAGMSRQFPQPGMFREWLLEKLDLKNLEA